MSKRDKAYKQAKERYRLDYKGILLNAGVSAMSSITASGFLNIVQAIPLQQLPLTLLILFVAQVLPKLIVELNKRHARNRARREGYKEGLLNDDFRSETENVKMNTSNFFISMCEHASYF